MPPQAPIPQQDPYEFILNPEKPKRQSPLGGASFGLKIALVALVAIIIIIGGVVAGKMLGASQDAQKDQLIEIAQTQNEIIRVATTASSQASSSNVKALATTTKISVQSSQNQIVDQLGKYGVKKVDNKLLGKTKNSKNDALLNEAKANNRYDETYRKILQEQLDDYQTKLKGNFQSATKKEKPILNTAFESNALIIQMSGIN